MLGFGRYSEPVIVPHICFHSCLYNCRKQWLQIVVHDFRSQRRVGGNLTATNHTPTWAGCSQTEWSRFANNWHLISKHRQITNTLLSIWISATVSFCNSGLDSAGSQLFIFWLYSYIKARLSSPFVVVQLNCCLAATTSLFMEEFLDSEYLFNATFCVCRQQQICPFLLIYSS